VQQVPSDGHVTEPQPLQHTLPTSSFTEKELKKKFVPELKQIAKDLNIPFPSSIKKDDLVRKILARAAGRRSEQYAIQDI
jgi:hypothetical protein